MKLGEVEELLTNFRNNIENLSKQIIIDNIKYDKNNVEEKFLYEELIFNAMDNILYGGSIIDYINKPMAKEGILKARSGFFWIDDFKLKDFDIIEIFDREWIKVDINKINNEFYMDLCPIKNFKENNYKARIRLSKEELNSR